MPSVAYNRPATANAAMRQLAKRQLLPTSAGSDDIQQWSRDIRDSSLFSARTTHLGYLERIQDVTNRMLSGEINIATGRMELQQELGAIGYTPEGGFPGDTAGAVPPAQQGTLQDLSSDRRLALILETNTARAQNFALKVNSMDDDARYQFPAWELVRVEDREVPRDEMPNGLAWPVRWTMAGGQLVQGRMVARKDDPIWSNLGSSALFPDGMDSEVPPYAFNSGMGWREVPREEAVALGLIQGDEIPGQSESRFFAIEDVDLSGFSTAELETLLQDLRNERAA